MNFVCKKQCFWRNRLWKPGEIVGASEVEYKDSMLSGPCWEKSEAVAVAPANEPAKVVLADEITVEKSKSVVLEPDDAKVEGAGTNKRQVLKDLCAENCLAIKRNASMASMEKALAAAGVKVS